MGGVWPAVAASAPLADDRPLVCALLAAPLPPSSARRSRRDGIAVLPHGRRPRLGGVRRRGEERRALLLPAAAHRAHRPRLVVRLAAAPRSHRQRTTEPLSRDPQSRRHGMAGDAGDALPELSPGPSPPSVDSVLHLHPRLAAKRGELSRALAGALD